MRLCVGTEHGVVIVNRTEDGRWSVDGRALDGYLVHGLAARLSEPTLVFAATRGAGLWRSRDAGASWQRVGADILPPKTRCARIVEAGGALTVYVGTEPIALYRSPDGGDTWEELADVRRIAAERGWRYPLASVEPHVRDVAVHPADSRLLLLAMQVGGILRSADGGTTWEHVGPDQLDPDVHSIVCAAPASDAVYAATGGGGRRQYPPPAGFAAYRSDDRGRTWRLLTTTLDRTYAVPIRVSPADPERLLLGTGHETPVSWPGRPTVADAALYRSADGGATWERLTRGVPAPLTMMPDALEFHPRAPGWVVAGTGGEGGQLLPPDQRDGSLLASADGGDTWEQAPLRLPSIFALAFL
jgi:photosystem II stability/assembly factor-like uncharacterized protein